MVSAPLLPLFPPYIFLNQSHSFSFISVASILQPCKSTQLSLACSLFLLVINKAEKKWIINKTALKGLSCHQPRASQEPYEVNGDTQSLKGLSVTSS